MTRPEPTPRDAANHAVNGELKPHVSDVLLDREDFCFQLLGLDSEDRAVFYCSDDGTLTRYEYLETEHELERDEDDMIGYDVDRDSERVAPFATAFCHVWGRERDWTWIHPRFRWLTDPIQDLTRGAHPEVSG